MSVLLDDNLIWIAFLMGIAGSAHCIGMCGGFAALASATSDNHKNRPRRGRPLLLVTGWLSGKTVTYALLGAVLGALSEAVPSDLKGFQTIVVVMTSAFLIVTGLHLAGFGPNWSLVTPSPVSRLVARMSSAVKSSSLSGRFILGLLNGLLPCGLVYAALAYSLTYQSVVQGALFMTFFGIGTMPALVLVGFGTGLLAARRRQVLSKILGWFLILLGLYTLMRLPVVMHLLHGSGMSM